MTNRGLRRGLVFLDNTDRSLFVRFLGDALVKYETEACAYCLMGNHFHLILHCPDGGLSSTMQHLLGRFSRRFNRRHGFDGSVFRSRFYSKRIVDDRQLVATTRYVHRNPLERGFRIDDYPWSSYALYLSGEKSGWLRTEIPLGLVGGAAEYRRLVEQPLPSDKFSGVRRLRSMEGPPIDLQPSITEIDQRVIAAGHRHFGRSLLKYATLVVAADRGYSSTELSEYFAYSSPESARSALSKARRTMSGDEDFARLVQWASGGTDLRLAG